MHYEKFWAAGPLAHPGLARPTTTKKAPHGPHARLPTLALPVCIGGDSTIAILSNGRAFVYFFFRRLTGTAVRLIRTSGNLTTPGGIGWLFWESSRMASWKMPSRSLGLES